MAVRRKKAGSEFLLLDALKDLCAEKEINQDTLFDAIESALIFACKKTANADKKVVVDLDRTNGTFHVYELRDVVEDVKNKNREISLADAKSISPKYELGDVVRTEVPPNNFGRIAAQAAKQFVMQKIREAERGVVYDEFTNSENDIVTGTVTRIEDGNVIVDIGKTEAILVPVEQIYTDRFKIGDRVRAYVAEVRKMGKGPQVYLSRTHPALLRRLFELEVPEIQEGIITIKGVAREAGNRSKLAVTSQDPNIDPVGSCLGEHGVRAQAVTNELGGREKIDIVKWDEDPAIYIANALSPSKVMKVAVNEYDKMSRVVVPNNQLSLAIGKEGQNARLAAKLTGWKIDIKSKSQARDEVLSEDMREVKLVADKPKKKGKKKGKDNLTPDQLQENQQPKPKKDKKPKQDKPKVEAAPQPAISADPFAAFDSFGDDAFSAFDSFEEQEPAAETEKPATPSKPAETPKPEDTASAFDAFGAFEDFGEPEPEPAPEPEKPVEAEKPADVEKPKPKPEKPKDEEPADPFGAFDAFDAFDSFDEPKDK